MLCISSSLFLPLSLLSTPTHAGLGTEREKEEREKGGRRGKISDRQLMSTRQIKREVKHAYAVHTHIYTRISSLVRGWCRQCISDIRPIVCSYCLSPFSNIHITAQASICLFMYACVFLSVCLSACGRGELGFSQRDCLDIGFSCLTELSGMLL